MDKSRESEVMKKLARALIDTYGMAEANELLIELSAMTVAIVNNELKAQRKELRAEIDNKLKEQRKELKALFKARDELKAVFRRRNKARSK